MTPSTEEKQNTQAKEDAGVATEKENAKLHHSANADQKGADAGGVTTRDDSLDAGVPMVQGDPSEPVGPEDALGVGPKRGDYRNRQDGTEHFESVAREGKPVLDDDGNVVDYEPDTELVPQSPRVEDIGDVKGEKGGVTTA